MWSSCSRNVDYGVISATVCCILQSCECVVSSLFQSGFRATSMPEVYLGGKVDDVPSRIGWCSGRVMVLKAYFRQVCCNRIPGGGRGASNSMGMIGDARNAPKSFCKLCFAVFVAYRCTPSVLPTRAQFHSQEWG